MAEKWKLQDSARKMTQKHNDLVEEVNNLTKDSIETESAKVAIDDGLTNEQLDNILKRRRINS